MRSQQKVKYWSNEDERDKGQRERQFSVMVADNCCPLMPAINAE